MPNNLIRGTLDNDTGYALITVNLASSDRPDARRLDGKKALIDTGATDSAIDKELIRQLGLDQLGTRDGYSFDRMVEDVPYYAGRIEIPELSLTWDLSSIQPTKGVAGRYDAIIGMDILISCTLMVTGPVKKFALMGGTPDRGIASIWPRAGN